ncbi:MAG TPA: hypothetical protein VFR97_08805 [Capillimicrobium sp.]|nr:hypothetical protein [Capillimicrobium sp.]
MRLDLDVTRRSLLLRIGVVAAGVVAVLAGYVILATFVLHGPVDGRSLLRSVSGVANSVGEPLEPCDPATKPRVWNCTVGDREGSGTVEYRVTLRPDSSCWDAILVDDYSEGGMPRYLNGCVRRMEWSLL